MYEMILGGSWVDVTQRITVFLRNLDTEKSTDAERGAVRPMNIRISWNNRVNG